MMVVVVTVDVVKSFMVAKGPNYLKTCDDGLKLEFEKFELRACRGKLGLRLRHLMVVNDKLILFFFVNIKHVF